MGGRVALSLSATPNPGFFQSTALLNSSPSSPRAVVREHGEGQPAQCLEDTVRGQHLPGTACLRSLSPPPPLQDARCPRTQRGVGVEQGSVLNSLQLLKQAVSLKATSVHKLFVLLVVK